MSHLPPRDILQALFATAVRAAQPAQCLPPFLPAKPIGRTVVIGFGKSAAAMAQSLEQHWDGDLSGVVLTRYGHSVPCQSIKVLQASHPVPDQAGVDGTAKILEQVNGLSADDLVICLISGGGSALFIQPPDGVTLADKQALTTELLRCGATISEINTIRKQFSRVKGGRLATACAPAKVVSLIISDVPGDDLSLIASGPTAPDGSTSKEASAILSRYGITLSPAMQTALSHANAAPVSPSNPAFENVENRLIATPQRSLEAAAKKAAELGITPIILSDRIEGEAREVAKMMAATARNAKPPCVLLSGGETTVTITGNGKGGPNTEFLLALAIALEGQANIHAISCDTDGIDGSEDNAGAIITPDTLERAVSKNLNAADYLANNDAYSFFKILGDLVTPGPTLTNVNDFRAVLVG